MHIKSISMENFASYENASIELSDGLTITLGKRNGSGKTTIAEALSRAITGEYLSNVKDNDRIRHGANEFTITVEGTHNGEEIKITLMRSKKKSNIEVIHGNEKEEGTMAKNYLSELILPEEFKTLVYINGHTLEDIIRGTPQARSKLLDKMLGIQSLQMVIDALKTRKILSQISELSIRLEQKIEEKTNLEKLVEDSKMKEVLEKQYNDLRARLDDLEEERERITERLRESEAEWREYQKSVKEREKIEKAINRLEIKRKSYGEEIKRIKGKIAEINERVSKIGGGKDSDVLKVIDEKIKEIDEKISRAEISSATELRKRIIKENLKVCPVCKSKVNIEKIKSVDELLSDAEDLTELQRKKRRFETARIKLEEMSSMRSELIAREEKIEREMEKLSEKIENLSEKYRSISPTPPPNYEDSKRELLQVDERIAEVKRQMSNIESTIESIEPSDKLMDMLTIINDEISDIRQKLAERREKMEKIKRYKSGLKNVLAKIRRETIEEINPTIQQWINRFIQSDEEIPPISFSINVEEKQTNKTHSVWYEPVAMRYGVPIKFDALSTGQKAICILAFILALEDNTSNHIHLIIFDELYTSGLDSIAIKEILRNIVAISRRMPVLMLERRKEIAKTVEKMAIRSDVPIKLYEISQLEGVSYISERNTFD